MNREAECSPIRNEKHEQTAKIDLENSVIDKLHQDCGNIKPHSFDPVPPPHPKPPKPFSDLEKGLGFPSLKDLFNIAPADKSIKDSKDPRPKIVDEKKGEIDTKTTKEESITPTDSKVDKK